MREGAHVTSGLNCATHVVSPPALFYLHRTAACWVQERGITRCPSHLKANAEEMMLPGVGKEDSRQ